MKNEKSNLSKIWWAINDWNHAFWTKHWKLVEESLLNHRGRLKDFRFGEDGDIPTNPNLPYQILHRAGDEGVPARVQSEAVGPTPIVVAESREEEAAAWIGVVGGEGVEEGGAAEGGGDGEEAGAGGVGGDAEEGGVGGEVGVGEEAVGDTSIWDNVEGGAAGAAE